MIPPSPRSLFNVDAQSQSWNSFNQGWWLKDGDTKKVKTSCSGERALLEIETQEVLFNWQRKIYWKCWENLNSAWENLRLIHHVRNIAKTRKKPTDKMPKLSVYTSSSSSPAFLMFTWQLVFHLCSALFQIPQSLGTACLDRTANIPLPFHTVC